MSWRVGRQWQLILPRVIQLGKGELDAGQRLIAASLFGGHGAVVTSLAAATWHGVTAACGDPRVHIEVPCPRGPKSVGFVVVRRTYRPDPHPWDRPAVRIASRARAVIAASRDAVRSDQSRAIVIESLQRGITTPAALRQEVEAGPRAGSARPRAALQEAEAGAWSVPEADLLHLLTRSTVLPAVWANPRLSAPDGNQLPRPDAWIDEVALAIQVHSRRFHAAQLDWERTVMSDGVFAEYGIIVIAVTPAAIDATPDTVRRRIERAYQAAVDRPRPAISAVPSGHGNLPRRR
jgi:hypothetical protein